METSAAKDGQSADNSEKEISELSYDYAWRLVDRAASHFERVDTKIATLGGFVGVMLTILFALVPSVFAGGVFSKSLLLVQCSFGVTTLGLVAAMMKCFRALKSHSILECPQISDFIETIDQAQTATRLRQSFTGSLAQVDQTYMHAIRKKMSSYNLALNFSLFAMSFLILTTILQAVSNLLK